MQPNKSSKTKRKVRLLLDSAFPQPTKLPKLCKKAHVMHSTYTLGLSREAEDAFIYQKATQEDCIVVTIDDDFKKLTKPNRAGVIIAPADLSVIEMEKSLLEFIKGKSPDDLRGKCQKISH